MHGMSHKNMIVYLTLLWPIMARNRLQNHKQTKYYVSSYCFKMLTDDKHVIKTCFCRVTRSQSSTSHGFSSSGILIRTSIFVMKASCCQLSSAIKVSLSAANLTAHQHVIM